MIALLALACVKAPQPLFAHDFQRGELPALQEPALEPNACVEQVVLPIEERDGELDTDCVGLIITNASVELCRQDRLSFEFWEAEARAQWRYRDADRAVCNSEVVALRTELRTVSAANALHKAAGPLYFLAGAATATAIAFAVREATR